MSKTFNTPSSTVVISRKGIVCAVCLQACVCFNKIKWCFSQFSDAPQQKDKKRCGTAPTTLDDTTSNFTIKRKKHQHKKIAATKLRARLPHRHTDVSLLYCIRVSKLTRTKDVLPRIKGESSHPGRYPNTNRANTSVTHIHTHKSCLLYTSPSPRD